MSAAAIYVNDAGAEHLRPHPCGPTISTSICEHAESRRSASRRSPAGSTSGPTATIRSVAPEIRSPVLGRFRCPRRASSSRSASARMCPGPNPCSDADPAGVTDINTLCNQGTSDASCSASTRRRAAGTRRSSRTPVHRWVRRFGTRHQHRSAQVEAGLARRAGGGLLQNGGYFSAPVARLQSSCTADARRGASTPVGGLLTSVRSALPDGLRRHVRTRSG